MRSDATGRVPARLALLLAAAAVGTTAVLIYALGIPLSGAPPAPSPSSSLPAVLASGQVVADGRAVPVRTVELGVDAPGTVAAVLVAVGERISAGTVLVRLDEEAVETELKAAGAAVEAAVARRDQAGAAVTQAREQIAVAEANEALAKAALDTARDRETGEAEAAASLDGAKAQVRVARAGLTGAEQALVAARAEVVRAQAAADSLELARKRLTITAPFDGLVASIDVRVGARVGPGLALVRLADTSAWEFVSAELDESAIARIEVGDAAVVTLDGIPGSVIEGTIARIGAFGSLQRGSVSYEVVVTPSGPLPAGVRWNMSATIQITPAR